MTISSSIVKSGPYSGNDVTTSFDYNFKIFADADLRVVLTDSAGVETDLVLNTDYSVSGAGDDLGGSITYPVSGSPLATGESLTILSNIDVEQSTDLSNQGGFFSEVHENVFDRLCRMIQQFSESLSRAVKAPLSDDGTTDFTLPVYSAGKALVWNESTKELDNSNDNFNNIVSASQTAQAASETAQGLSETAQAASETAQGLSEAARDASIVAQSGAETAETASTEWSQHAENVLVPSGNMIDEYSAFHWSKKAQAAATGTLTYMGSWDASTAVYPTSPDLGDYYKINVAGTISGTVYAVGDSIIYNGTDWDKIDNTEQVTSVNGLVGAVVLNYTHVGAEQAFSKNTGFNREFGSDPGTVAQGDHTHAFKGALVRMTVGQSVTSGTFVDCVWGTTIYDTDSLVSGNTFVVPAGASKVRVSAYFRVTNSTFVGRILFTISVSGSPSWGAPAASKLLNAADPNAETTMAGGAIAVATGDIIKCTVTQDNGGTLVLNQSYCWFAMEIIE